MFGSLFSLTLRAYDSFLFEKMSFMLTSILASRE